MGRGTPINFSAVFMVFCIPFLSCIVATPNQMMMDVHRTNFMTVLTAPVADHTFSTVAENTSSAGPL